MAEVCVTQGSELDPPDDTDDAAAADPMADPPPAPGVVPPGGPRHTHYAAVRRLGGGAFGEVMAGKHVFSGREVALKRVLLRRPERGRALHYLMRFTSAGT
jgi:hypothetical protein